MNKFLCLLFTCIAASAAAQQSTVDSLEKELQQATSDSVKFIVIKQLTDHAAESDLQKSLQFAGRGVALAEKTKDKTWLPKFYEMKGRIHANLLQLDSASLYFDKAMIGYKADANMKGQATTYFKMGWIYKKKGEIDKALEADLAALKIMEDLQDPMGMAGAYERVSEDLIEQGRLNKAMSYAKKAVDICKKNDLRDELVYALTSAGSVAINMGKNQEAYDYFNEALMMARKENFGEASFPDFYNNRGNALKRLGRYTEALADYNIAFTLAKKLNYANAIAPTIANMGEVNLLLGNYKAALPFQLETVHLQEMSNDKSNLTENYLHVSTIYEKLKNYKEALAYQQKAMKLNDSIRSAESDTVMSAMLTKYESAKQQNTIAAQNKEISQQRKIQWMGLGLLILLSTLIIFGIFTLRIRKRRNRLLATKNAENELLLKEIHHRVKNNLEVVSSILALQSAQIDDPNTKEAMLEGQNRVHSIGIVHQKLYQGKDLGAIEMKDYFVNLTESILDSFGAEGRVNIKLAMEKLDVDIDTAVPLGLIVNELLTNTLKYAFPKGTNGIISIHLERRKDNILHLEVSDNGIGKSNVIQGSGFGSQLISLLTRQLNGNMKEEIENGTRIFFDFKLDKVA